MNERMAASWASPPGPGQGGAAGDPDQGDVPRRRRGLARRRRRSGTGTRVIAFAGFTAASWAAGSAFDNCLDRAQVLLPAAPYQKAQER